VNNYYPSKWLACLLLLAVSVFSSCQKKHETSAKPEENRFIKTILTQGEFTEPTEMTILPNLDVLVVGRRGQIMWYNAATKKLKQVGMLDVYYKTKDGKANSEEGLLGLTADPDFANNHYIYMYYSPVDTSVDRLSRFEFKNDTVDLKSEKVILEVKTQREICCHTGGSMAFDKDNDLFVSTGDNSTPFDEAGQPYATHAFGPMDDRPGHQQYDSRRSAANTNDLRGKILRIKIHSDGSYSIPEGNLFPPGEAKTRAEIYIMGDRNPYRISVDKESGNLYWGEVGPDAPVDSPGTRGSRGYDEINQARKAGNFGWPLFVGNNSAYNRHNYKTNVDGPAYDPEKPVNESRNNTGLLYLPPAQPAFIWYPYAVSKDFPMLGSGGRCSMAGPVYNYDDYADSTRYPAYYDGKLFIYDFMRGWIKAVTMKPNGDYDHMEGFMDGTKFNSMIDMEVGPDGRIYVLEYGSGWYTGNPDAALVRLDYLPGNRPPAVSGLAVNKTTGNLPFVLNATVKAVDPENDALDYVWSVGSIKIETKAPVLHYTINKVGDYDVSVEVFDVHKASNKSSVISIYAGNAQPQIAIDLPNSQGFYFPGKPVSYKVRVTDSGDKVNPKNLYVSTRFFNSSDLNGPALGDQQVPETVLGKNLMLSLDCKSCHKVDSTSIGPSFKNVAKRYIKQAYFAGSFLPKKIIKGGSGSWGQTAMSAHPSLKFADAREIVTWILSLADTTPKARSLAASGAVIPKIDPKQPQNTVFSVNATYTDNGGPGIRALSAAKTVYLRSSIMDEGEFLNPYGFSGVTIAKVNYLAFPADKGSFNTAGLNLSAVKSIEFSGISRGLADYKITVMADSEHGKKIGEGTISFKVNQQNASVKIVIQKPADNKLHNYYVVCKQVSTVKSAYALPLLKTLQFLPGK
jgi:cytochrome c